MLYIVVATVNKDYGRANAVIGVTKTLEKAEELIDSISIPDYPLCFDEIDGYSIFHPKIIEVENLNTLCVCLDDDGLNYSDD